MKIEKFEDIESWKKARELTKMVYELTELPGFFKDFGLKDQIQRASVSVMANIAEGFDTETDPEFIRFLTYSRRSATEVQSHLYVALDRKYVSKDDFRSAFQHVITTKNLIYGFIRYLRLKRKNLSPST